MKKGEMVLASAVLAFVMLTSMFALPALGASGSSSEVASVTSSQATAVTETTEEATTAGLATDPQVFTMATVGEPYSLDPAVDYDTSGCEVIQNVYQTLVWYDRESAQYLVPVLATEIPSLDNGGISADGMNYTFTIREGVTFHDGTPLTAEDVTYSVQRALRIHDPTGPSWMLEQVMTCYLSYYLYGELQTYIDDNAPPQWILDAIGETDPTYILTEDDMTAVAEAAVTQVDGMTVNFRLTEPYAPFIKICASPVMSILSKDFVEANGGIVNGEFYSYLDSHPCGTGPYELVTWDKGVQIHMTRFSGYWGAAPAIEDIYIVLASDEATRITLLENGAVDSALLSTDYESWFADDPDFEISKGVPTFDMTFTGFNMEIDTVTAADFGSEVPTDFFADKHVRTAFVHMLDYSTYIENVLEGNAIQPNGAIPMGMFGYDPSVPNYSYDLELAKEELKLAINPATSNSYWEDGFRIALFYNAGNTYRETACNYLKAGLDELTDMAAGDTDAVFEGVVNTLDWPTYVVMRDASPSPFPMYYLGWTVDYADPDDYATALLDSVYGVFSHLTGYSNSAIDYLVRAAAVELDEEVRAQIYSDMGMLVYEDAPYMWLWQGCNFHVQRSWVDGYYFNPMYGGLYYAALSKTAPEVAIEAVIDATPDYADVWTNVTFDGSGSYSVAGTILEYWWDFGDGSYAAGSVVEYCYAVPGDYIVSLYVRDDLDQNDSSVILYRVLGEPGATGDAYEDDDVYTDASVIFVGETQVHSISDGGTDVDWAMFTLDEPTDIAVKTSGPAYVYGDTVLWLYDESGVPFTEIGFCDDYGYYGWSMISADLGPGTYYIMVQSYGMYSEIPEYYLTVDLSVPTPPYVELYCSSNYVAVGDAVWLYAYAYDADGYIEYFDWDFGDGTVWEYCWNEVNYSYYELGEYTVTVTAVDDSGMTASASTMIFVVTAPVAVISVSPEVGIVGSPSTFDGTLSYNPEGLGIIYYWWDFGDGWGGDGAVVTHTYFQAGTYLVTLQIYDESYGWDYAQMWYEVVDAAPPVAIVAYDIPMPLVGQTVTFDGSWSFDPDGTIVRYIWQFGDGTVAEGMYAEHAYANSGVYEVRLTVVDDSMLTDENTVWITVVSVPVAAFEMNPEKPAVGDLVTFYAYGSYDGAGIVDYSWSFGDGTYANGWEVSHVYTATGRYTVTLTVTNTYGVQSSVSESFTVRGHSPSITGTVVDAASEPVKNAAVALYKDGVLVAQVRTDKDGQFAFGTLEPGVYLLVASKGGVGAVTVTVTFTGTPVDLGELVLGSGGVLV